MPTIGKDCRVRDNDLPKICIDCIMTFSSFGICKLFVDSNNTSIVDKASRDISCVFLFIDLTISATGIPLDSKKDSISSSFLVVASPYYKINK